jgi:ribonuclease P protein subunit POP4
MEKMEVDDIFEMNDVQKKLLITTVGSVRGKKIQKLKEFKKKEIFNSTPESFMKKINSEVGVVSFTQNDAQKVGEKHELKKKSLLHRKKQNMTSKEKKKSSLFKIEKEKLNYDKIIPLNELWKTYITELLDQSKGLTSHSEVLLKADLHGSIMKCTRSKNPTYVGIEGIMLQETENSFKILTKDNSLKSIPFYFIQ